LTDACQQLPPLQLLEILSPYQTYLSDPKNLKVVDLWLTTQHNTPWHNWKVLPQDLHLQDNVEIQTWKETLGNKKIRISRDKDILHWGFSTTGNFMIKEAYKIQKNFQAQEKDHI
jgi:hypothetical protein